MRAQVFSSTHPTWAPVGGTSRPAGETVYHISCLNTETPSNCRRLVSNIVNTVSPAGLEVPPTRAQVG